MDDRYKKVLGLDEYRPKTEWVCFLPWGSEFGWYIMNHVKRVHGYNHPNKIVCIKRGHECLFPSAKEYWYHWQDYLPDNKKGGIAAYKYNNQVKKWVTAQYGKSITFLDPRDTGWPEKTSLAKHTFVPQPKNNHDFDIDVVITPRLRQVETHRNYPQQWQEITNMLLKAGLRVGVCGSSALSVPIKGAHYYSWNYTDIDTDVEMILKSKIVISQESGLAYLTMMCKKPLIIIDTCHYHVAKEHHDKNVYFKNIKGAWNHKDQLLKEIKTVVSANK